MKIILLTLIVLLESVNLPLSFIDEAHFFNIPKLEKEELSIPEVRIESIPSFPKRVGPINQRMQIDGKGYLSADLNSGAILAHKNLHKKRPIASLAKMMTATIALEEIEMGQKITVPKSVSETTGSKIWIQSGSQFTVKELVKCALIKSANDCAYTIGAGYDKENGKKSFVKKMNKKAKELGMNNTKYVEPTGLSEKNQSTPWDQFLLVKYALTKPLFRQIVGTYQATIRNTTGYGFPVTNTNRLLRIDPTVFGVKTGYLEEAGQCFAGGVERNNQKIITVLLGATSNNTRFWETQELMKASYSNYAW